MSTRLIFLILIVMAPMLEAAEGMSPRLAQRLVQIMNQSVDNPDSALEDLADLLNSRSLSDTDRGYVVHERAALLIQQDQSSRARLEIEAVLEGKADDYVPQLRMLLSQLLLFDEEPQLAIAHLEIWLRHTDNPRATELSMLGYTYLQLERYVEAAEVLERAIALSDLPLPQWMELLAFAYVRSGRADEGIALLEQLIVDQPDQARWWAQLANIYLLLEDIPKGTAGIYIAGLVEDLEYQDSKRLASLFIALNMPADAASLLAAAIEKSSASGQPAADFEDLMLIAEMWVLAREKEKAIQAFEQAAASQADGEPYLKIAQLLLQWENYTAAQTALSRALQLYGDEPPPQVLYLLSIVEINLHDLESAQDLLVRLEGDENYSERARRLQQYIQSQLIN